MRAVRVRIFLLSLLSVVAFGWGGCVSAPKAPKRQFRAADYAPTGTSQLGLASWYGDKYRGKPTASGERFDPGDSTAAHRTLRFGTVVEVRNLRNGRRVLVEINDRGPFIKGRVIDLSEAAARELDMVREGVVPVEVRVMRRR